MFSHNPYTRRRQQLSAFFALLTGVLSAIGVLALVRTRLEAKQVALPSLPTVSADGRFQVRIDHDTVVVEEAPPTWVEKPWRTKPLLIVMPFKGQTSPLNQIVSAGFASGEELQLQLRIAQRTVDGNYILQDKVERVSLAPLYGPQARQLTR